MKVSVFGLGYVGCVTAAGMARAGHSVIGVDVNPRKVELIQSGRSPVVEAGLDELIGGLVGAGLLSATEDGRAAARGTDVSLICVGTPSNGNGSLTLDFLASVSREIGAALAGSGRYHVVAVRSTVLPGTIEDCVVPILEEQSGLRLGADFGVCMNPEFLREGTALSDFDDPSQIVIGQSDERSGDLMHELYAHVEAPVIRTSIRTAEMVKYVSNAYHALKVAFANEVGSIAKAHNIDGQEVMEIFCQDRRLNISPVYLRPGFAFGGSCLPKDLRALVYRARERDVECPVLNAVLPSNQRQLQRGIALVEGTGHKRVGVLGLSFKEGTDDVRESPVVALVETLVGRGHQVSIYDETVHPEQLLGANKLFLERELPHIASLLRPSMEDVIESSDVVVLTNRSQAFREVPELVRENQVLIDLVGAARVETAFRGQYEGIAW